MGRKTSRRRTPPRKSPVRGGGDSDEEVSDDMSEVSNDTVAVFGLSLEDADEDGDPNPALQAKLAEQLELLSERRAATRVEALEKVIALLKMLPTEVVATRRATSLDAILGLLRKAAEREAVLALRALCVVFVHHGPEQERVVMRVFPVLKRIVTRGERGSPRRVWALHALGTAVFVCAEEKSHTEAVMRMCVEVLTGSLEGTPVTADLEVAALEIWTLLASVETQPYNSKKAYAWHLQLFLGKLEATLPDVRAAAGEALALMEEQWRMNPHLHVNSRNVRETPVANGAGTLLFYETERVKQAREAKEEDERHEAFLAALKIAEDARIAARAAAAEGEAGKAPGAPMDEDEEEEGLLKVPDVEGLLRAAKIVYDAKAEALGAAGGATGGDEAGDEAGDEPGDPAESAEGEMEGIAAAAGGEMGENDGEGGDLHPDEDVNVAVEDQDDAHPAPRLENDVSTATSTEGGRLNIDAIMEEILQRLQELSTQSSKTMSRKARKFERRAFREIQRSLQDEEAPTETLIFPNGELVVEGYSGILQLAAMRRILRSGLQRQLATNSFLQEVFEVDEDITRAQGAGERMDAIDKRLTVSKSSSRAKERTAARTNERRRRQNQKNFALDQGDF